MLGLIFGIGSRLIESNEEKLLNGFEGFRIILKSLNFYSKGS